MAFRSFVKFRFYFQENIIYMILFLVSLVAVGFYLTRTAWAALQVIQGVQMNPLTSIIQYIYIYIIQNIFLV